MNKSISNLHPELSIPGRTAGGLYAGASAGHGVGASAAIGGGLDAGGVGAGGVGAESHVGSVSKKVVKLTETQPESVKTVNEISVCFSLFTMKLIVEKFMW